MNDVTYTVAEYTGRWESPTSVTLKRNSSDPVVVTGDKISEVIPISRAFPRKYDDRPPEYSSESDDNGAKVYTDGENITYKYLDEITGKMEYKTNSLMTRPRESRQK